MKPVIWRVYARGKRVDAPSTLVGCVTAETKSEALADAQIQYFGKAVEVVSEIAWQAMGARERELFTGTHEFPEDDDPHPNIRKSTCRECGSVILYGRGSAGKWRNPPKRCKGPGCERKPAGSGKTLRRSDTKPVD